MLLFALAAIHADESRAQWVQVNEPNGRSVVQRIISIGANIFAKTQENAVFSSTNNGNSWNFRGYSDSTILPIFLIGSTAFGQNSLGIYTSKDSGISWLRAVDSNWPEGYFSYKVSGSIIFAYASGDGILMSSDSGNSWDIIGNTLPPNFSGFALSGENLFVAYDSGIFVSRNNGTSWSFENDSFGNIQSFYTFGNNIFVNTQSKGPLLSTDDGATWKAGGWGGYINEFVVSGNNIYAGTPWGTFLSTDTGLSWTELTYDSSAVYSMAIVDTNIFEGTDVGLFRYTASNPKGTWIGVPTGISSLLSFRNNLFADGAISTDGGISWHLTNPYPILVMSSSILASSVFGIGGSDNGIMVSMDNGLSWSWSDLPHTVWFPSIVRMRNDLFASTSRFSPEECDTDVFRSTDWGRTWSVVFRGLQPVVYSTLALFTDNRLIFAGSRDDNHFACYESTNYGASWQPLDSTSIWCCGNSNGPFYPANICCLAPRLAAQLGTIFIGLDSGKLFLSTNDGTDWELIDNILSGDSIISAATIDNNLFVSTKNGRIFLSSDTCSNWKNITGSLYDTNILCIATTNDYLFAADANYSLWRHPLSDFGVAAVTPLNSQAASLRVYPNPLSQSTTISFSSRASGYAEVSVVNSLGMEVANLYSGDLAAGEHGFTWSEPSICNGMYECLVRMNGELQSAGIIVMR